MNMRRGIDNSLHCSLKETGVQFNVTIFQAAFCLNVQLTLAVVHLSSALEHEKSFPGSEFDNLDGVECNVETRNIFKSF